MEKASLNLSTTSKRPMSSNDYDGSDDDSYDFDGSDDDSYDESDMMIIQEPYNLESYFNDIETFIRLLQYKNITKVSYLYFLEALEYNRRMVLYEISKLDNGASFSKNFDKYNKYFKKTPEHASYDFNLKVQKQNKILDDLANQYPKFVPSLDEVNKLEDSASLSGNTTSNVLKKYENLKFQKKIEEMKKRSKDIRSKVETLRQRILEEVSGMTFLDNIRKALLYKISVLFFDKKEDDIPQSYLQFLLFYDEYFTEGPEGSFYQYLVKINDDTKFSIRNVQIFLRSLDNISSPLEIINSLSRYLQSVRKDKSLKSNFSKYQGIFILATQVPTRKGQQRGSKQSSSSSSSPQPLPRLGGQQGGSKQSSSSSSSPQRLTFFKSIQSIKKDFLGMQAGELFLLICMLILLIIVIIFVIRHFLISKKNRLKREKEEKTSTTTEINQEEAEVTTDLNEETEKKIEKEEEIKPSKNYVEYIINAILIGLFFYFLAMGMKNKKQIKKISKKKKTK